MADHSEMVTVCCSVHHDRLTSGLWNLLLSGHEVDFSVMPRKGVGQIRAHRLILDVFMSPDKFAQMAEFSDDVSVFNNVVEFIYTGKVNVPRMEMIEMLKIARTCDFQMLVDVLETSPVVKLTENPPTLYRMLNPDTNVKQFQILETRTVDVTEFERFDTDMSHGISEPLPKTTESAPSPTGDAADHEQFDLSAVKLEPPSYENEFASTSQCEEFDHELGSEFNTNRDADYDKFVPITKLEEPTNYDCGFDGYESPVTFGGAAQLVAAEFPASIAESSSTASEQNSRRKSRRKSELRPRYDCDSEASEEESESDNSWTPGTKRRKMSDAIDCQPSSSSGPVWHNLRSVKTSHPCLQGKNYTASQSLAASDYFESDSDDSDASDVVSDSDGFGESSCDESDKEIDFPTAKQWCSIRRNTPAPLRYPFLAETGVKVPVSDYSDVCELFGLFLDDTIVQLIVQETNKYAKNFLLTAELCPRSRVHRWKPITKSEFFVYLALTLLQGIIQKPKLEWYWSTRKTISTPAFPCFMTEKRFSLITKFLYFVNDKTTIKDGHPCWKLRKIWPIYSHLQVNFSKVYIPEQDISINESVMLHKGRQYQPIKHARRDIKFLMLCEVKTGYIWSSILYFKKGMALSSKYQHLSKTSQAIMTLMEPLLEKGYCMMVGNFYMSPELSDQLSRLKTDSYGTLCANRKGIPTELCEAELKVGQIIGFQYGKTVVMKWRNKNEVTMISTIHNMAFEDHETRNHKIVLKPQVVMDYNNSMISVNRVNQSLSYHHSVRKGSKIYYKKIFHHLVDHCVFNAFVIHKKMATTCKTLLEFRLQLVEKLLERHIKEEEIMPTHTGRKFSKLTPDRLTGQHFPEHIPPTRKSKKPRRLCVVCCASGKDGQKIRRETRVWCPQCDKGMCAIPCFKTFHAKSKP